MIRPSSLNNKSILENLYRILRMSLLLGDTENKDETVANFEDTAIKLDNIEQEEYNKNLDSKFYTTVTLEEEERKLSERSVNYYNSVIRFIYEVTMDKIINKKQLPMYRKRRKMKDVLTKEELSTFFNACENYMYKTIFMMIYGSGLRVSEAVNLRIEDIDSRKMRIFVRAGKGGKDRYTVLPKTSLEMLRKYYKMYKPKHPEGYMFLNREGNPLKVERLRVFFRRYRRKAGISEEFIVHSLRHAFATRLVEEGIPLVQVKELLGHSCIRSTMTYVHIANNMQKVDSPLDIFLKKKEEE